MQAQCCHGDIIHDMPNLKICNREMAKAKSTVYFPHIKNTFGVMKVRKLMVVVGQISKVGLSWNIASCFHIFLSKSLSVLHPDGAFPHHNSCTIIVPYRGVGNSMSEIGT